MAGCGSGPWGVSHASHKGAAEGTEDFVHKGRVCRLGLRLSADGGLQSFVQARARIWRIAVLDNTPVVIGPAVGPACLAGSFVRPLADPLRGRGGSGGMTGPGVALPLSLLQAGRGGPGSAAPARGMWEEVVEVLVMSNTMGC